MSVEVSAEEKSYPDCLDCGRPYPHGCDMVLTRKQWLMIHPDGDGVLCPSCIVNRAARLGCIDVQAVIMFCPNDPDGDSASEYIHSLRLENADYARENAELKYELEARISAATPEVPKREN